MQWETKIPTPSLPRIAMTCGPITITVVPANTVDDMAWQHLMLSLGSHSPLPIDECMATWPREALTMARAALDEFEAQLKQEELLW